MVRPNPAFPPVPPAFAARKSRILASLAVPAGDYVDKSPKGSVDAPIVDLIEEINGIDGLVTTSSCSGRVAVFVEGVSGVGKDDVKRGLPLVDGEAEERGGAYGDGGGEDEGKEDEDEEQQTKAVTGSPAGKGGGHWLFVSHDPVSIPCDLPPEFFTRLCGFPESSTIPTASPPITNHGRGSQPPRLIKFSFSPLILHIQCATLAHAKPLLTAAINSGFRESGVQSLKALEDPDAGVTVGIRTAGLALETVVGIVREANSRGHEERYEPVVNEEYLGLMFEVANGRFTWNERRRERLRAEIKKGFFREEGKRVWEDKEERRRRKREEGLRRQVQAQREDLDRDGGVDIETNRGVDVIEGLGVDRGKDQKHLEMGEASDKFIKNQS